MDDVDIANALVEADREGLVLLQIAMAATPRVPPRHARDGQRICVVCEQPISQKRQAAVPNAVACTACESAEEHRRRYRRKKAWAV